MFGVSGSRLFLALLALVGVLVTVMLGNWQAGRAKEKSEAQALRASAQEKSPLLIDSGTPLDESLADKRVELHGRFLDVHTILLDNRLRDGVPGYEVVTPLSVAEKHTVLVNRGWIRASPDRSQLPALPATAAEVSLIGLALPVSERFVELSRETVSGRIWQNLDLDRYRRATGLDLPPIVIQQTSDSADGLARNWPRPDQRVDTHRAYALQWYTMAAAIVIIYLIHHVRRSRNRR